MSLMLTRMFAYFTLFSYLVVGTVVVRFCMPESALLDINTSYLNFVIPAQFETSVPESIVSVPEMKFDDIKIPVEKVIVKRAVVKAVTPKHEPVVVEARILEANELPFYEPITLQKIEMNNELPVNMLASYRDFTFAETAIAKTDVVSDEVSTAMAATEEVEPEFFEYPVEDKKTEEVKVVDKKVEEVQVEVASTEVETENVTDMLEEKTAEPVMASATSQNGGPIEPAAEPEFFDYPVKQSASAQESVAATAQVATTTNVASSVAFDYSQAQKDISNQVIPTVTSHSKAKKTSSSQLQPTTPKVLGNEPQVNGLMAPDVSDMREEDFSEKVAPSTYPLNLSIQVMGSNLTKLQYIQGFEVRFQDDLSESLEDFGSGEVKFVTEMNQPKMTRSMTILKRGYIPTSTEVILEEGNGSVSIPMLEEDTFYGLQETFENRGAIGALLVELDDESELAKLDVPFGDVIKLDGDFKKTEAENFRYQLFVGVKAGNAMVSYHRGNGEIVTKIVHVHENEVTYDANFYEDVVNEKVRLYDEDLLAKESAPLNISGDQVTVFGTNAVAKKLNNHTYKMNFGSSNLGGRSYIELNHQSEPLFIGVRDNHNVTVPSENFMRHVLSNIEGSKLGNRCLVQVNLTKKAQKYEVASESVAASLMIYSQALDMDGKFYDSLSDKTRKIIIVGESQATSGVSPDAKINIKVQYEDGSFQYLSSYCSPNTYLVEQL